MSNKKVSELTVKELKDIIREVVIEEVTKSPFAPPLPVIPLQPFYHEVEQPYKRQEVWADTKTTIINREK